MARNVSKVSIEKEVEPLEANQTSKNIGQPNYQLPYQNHRYEQSRRLTTQNLNEFKYQNQVKLNTIQPK